MEVMARNSCFRKKMGVLRDLRNHAKEFVNSVFKNHPEQEVVVDNSTDLLKEAVESITSKDDLKELIDAKRSVEDMAERIEDETNNTVQLDSSSPASVKAKSKGRISKESRDEKDVEYEHEL